MPQLLQRKLTNGYTGSSSAPTPSAPTKDGSGLLVNQAVDVRDTSSMSVYISCSGGTSAVMKVQVTADPAGEGGWGDAAYREAGGAAYITTALTVVPATPRAIYLDPTDNVTWVRINVTANTGPTTITAQLIGER